MVIVRPDQRKNPYPITELHISDVRADVSLVSSLEDHDAVREFFEGVCLRPVASAPLSENRTCSTVPEWKIGGGELQSVSVS